MGSTHAAALACTWLCAASSNLTLQQYLSCCRLHMLTKHRIFVGPGFKIAQEVGDAASGGQILITHEAWGQLRQNMAGAGFPTVEQIGLFRLENSPQPTWIYQVSMAAVLGGNADAAACAGQLLGDAASHWPGPPAACCGLPHGVPLTCSPSASRTAQ